MDSLDILKKRLVVSGGNAEGRMSSGKEKTLKQALLYSYQAEIIYKDNKEHKALINNNKLKMDYDDKIISIPFESEFKVGDVFFWPKTEEHWLVYLRQYSEDAYFRGFIRKALHKVRWKNEFGKELEVYAAIRGPVETKIKGEMKSGIAFDIPNYTLSIIIPNNEDTKQLKRYSKISVCDKIWEVAVTDSISEPGVIDMQVIESYLNDSTDKPELPDGKEPDNLIVTTSLDRIETLEMDEGFRLWAIVEKDGKTSSELIENAKFIVKGGIASYEGGVLTPLEEGPLTIELAIDKAGYSKLFTVQVQSEELAPAMVYEIIGDEKVKSFGSTTYSIRHFVDGLIDYEVTGKWIVTDNKNLFTITSNTNTELTFKWKSGMKGKFEIAYEVEGNIVDKKNIVVEALI